MDVEETAADGEPKSAKALSNGGRRAPMARRLFPQAAPRWLVGVSIDLAIVATLCAPIVLDLNPAWLFYRWDATDMAPFAVSDQTEVGGRWRVFQRASVRLWCGPKGAHLVFRSRLPMDDDFREDWRPSKDFREKTHIWFERTFVNGKSAGSKGFETKSAMLEFGRIDTVATDPLTADQGAMLVDWLARGAPEGIRFSAFEFVMRYSGTAKAEEATAFLHHCEAAAS